MTAGVGNGVTQEPENNGDSGARGTRSRLVLSERDWAVLRWAHEQKFLEFDQVARWFPRGDPNPHVPRKANPTRGTVRRNERDGSLFLLERLRKLARFDVLRRVPLFTQSAAALLPGRTGFELLEGTGRSHGLARLDGIDWKNFAHDRAVTDIRWQLAGAPPGADGDATPKATEWRAERVLRRELGSGHIPDALAMIGSRQVAIEVELTRKSTPRYLSIFERYLAWRGPRLDAVLYVVPESSDLQQMFATVLPSALRKVELWRARTPDLRLFQFTTRNALNVGKVWSTASSPSLPTEGALWPR